VAHLIGLGEASYKNFSLCKLFRPNFFSNKNYSLENQFLININ